MVYYRLVLVAALVSSTAAAQSADPALLAQIQRMRAIDNHAHPPRVLAQGENDDDFDALPCDPLEPTATPLMMRAENPQYRAAWSALWGQTADVRAAKMRAQSAHGDEYPSFVLDKLGIDLQLSNRVAMGRGLNDAHHRWVPFDDALIFPLDNSALAAQTPDRKFFFSREDMLRRKYMQQLGITELPATLAEYTTRVVAPALERQKQQGAVAIKFEVAYLRSLDFAAASERDAAAVYARYARGGVSDTAEYRRLQDYLFRYVAAEAGRLSLPVHIHTGAGCGGYFYLAGANPLLLEPVLNDASLRKTTFVLLHAGAVAYTPAIGYLMMKPNVYADISQQTWMESPQHLAGALRYWLEWYPEKLLFGTDLAPGGSPEIDWEEIGWQTTQTARTALAIALTGMMRDNEITRAQALGFARAVLHDNAATLYHIGVPAKMEPHHHLVYQDSAMRVLRVRVPAHDTTLLHEHDPDYFWIALGASEVVNARPGQPDAVIKSSDLSIHYTPGHFAHVARNPGTVPFDNITVELLGDQTNVRNVCEASLANQPVHCAQEAADSHPAFATDQLQVALRELRPGASIDAETSAAQTWVIALDTMDTRSSLALRGGRWTGGVFHAAGGDWSIRNGANGVRRVITVVAPRR